MTGRLLSKVLSLATWSGLGGDVRDIDVLNSLEHMVAELVDGRAEFQAQRIKRKTVASAELLAELRNAFVKRRGGPGGWQILPEPEIHLEPNVIIIPDLAGWQLEKGDPHADTSVPYYTLPPQWVCEIVSSSAVHLDRDSKLHIYAEVGVEYAWVIEPMLRSIELYELRAGELALVQMHEGNAPLRVAPFDAIQLDTRELWL